MSRILISLVLAALTAVCIYAAYLTGKSHDVQSAWFFRAFSLLFAIPLSVVIVKALGQKNPGFKRFYDKLAAPKQEGARFVPHWLMMLIISIFGLIIALNIIIIIIRLVGS